MVNTTNINNDNPSSQSSILLARQENQKEKLEEKVKLNLVHHPEWNSAQKLARILWCIEEGDFCIISYHTNMQFLQFTRQGRNLIMNFPYSIKWPSRYLQVDRVGLILKSHGFGPNLALGAKFLKSEDFMLMQDSCNDKFAVLEAYFGFDHEIFASQVCQEIAERIWEISPEVYPRITLGSWKE
jgi:hypothetical protein